jgi:hypothetical protein
MPELIDRSDEELLVVIMNNPPGSPTFEHARIVLERRAARAQVRAAEAQVKASDVLVRLTGRLVVATWALVVATIVAAGVLAWVTWRVGTGAIRLG